MKNLPLSHGDTSETLDSVLRDMAHSDPFGNKAALRKADAERRETLGAETVKKIDGFLSQYGIA